MNYVDAGYTAALVIPLVYAIALVLRRRRWERALRAADTHEGDHPADHGTAADPVARGGRP